MANTGRDIVTYALKKAGITGVGRAPSAMDINDGLADLNDMVAEWNMQRWMVWNLVQLSKVSTGAESYTVGPGGDFDVTPAPNRIESAFCRQINIGNAGQPVDYPLEIIPSLEEYNTLALKSLVSFPKYVFYWSKWPTAEVRTYPIMNANVYKLFIAFKNVVPTMTLDTELETPAHYIPAMKFNLARRLRQAYGKGMKPDPELILLANNSLNVVKNANLQIPELVMPTFLLRPGLYNILSDQSY